MTIQFLCNHVKWQSAIIVCNNLVPFQTQTTAIRISNQVKENSKKVSIFLFSFFFFFCISENFLFRKLWLFATSKGILTKIILEKYYVCLTDCSFIKICDNNKKNGSVFHHFFFVQYCISKCGLCSNIIICFNGRIFFLSRMLMLFFASNIFFRWLSSLLLFSMSWPIFFSAFFKCMLHWKLINAFSFACFFYLSHFIYTLTV